MDTRTLLPALDDLQSSPQWVCWRNEQRHGKLTKVPYNATSGRWAASDNSGTWTSYAQAKRAYECSLQTAQPYDGIGYMFHEEITGIDLDHCIDAQGRVDAWAQRVIDHLASYTEYSPSRTGVHIFVRRTLPCPAQRDQARHSTLP